MEMQQIRYFLTLAEALNFTRAADSAGVSQPALTRSIQMLEAELGGPLFHRERQRTHLTELGRIMLPYFETVSMQVSMAKTRADALARSAGGLLRLGAMCTVGPRLISNLVVQFGAMYPDVEIVVSDATGGDLIEMLKEGDLHLALLGMPTELDSKLHGLSLFSERFHIVMSRQHSLAGKSVIYGSDLHGEAYVNRSKCEYAEHAGEQLVKAGIRPRTVFSSDRDDWIQGMIKEGVGFGFFPEFSITDPDVVSRPLLQPEFTRTIQLVTMRGRPHSPALGAFVARARTHPWPKARDRIDAVSA